MVRRNYSGHLPRINLKSQCTRFTRNCKNFIVKHFHDFSFDVLEYLIMLLICILCVFYLVFNCLTFYLYVQIIDQSLIARIFYLVKLYYIILYRYNLILLSCTFSVFLSLFLLRFSSKKRIGRSIDQNDMLISPQVDHRREDWDSIAISRDIVAE